MVMGRPFAMHTIGEHVVEEVGVERGRRELTQLPFRVEVRKRDSGQEQGEQFERSMIALRRDVGAEASDLIPEAREEQIRESFAERLESRRLGEEAPCLEPVLDSARR